MSHSSLQRLLRPPSTMSSCRFGSWIVAFSCFRKKELGLGRSFYKGKIPTGGSWSQLAAYLVAPYGISLLWVPVSLAGTFRGLDLTEPRGSGRGRSQSHAPSTRKLIRKGLLDLITCIPLHPLHPPQSYFPAGRSHPGLWMAPQGGPPQQGPPGPDCKAGLKRRTLKMTLKHHFFPYEKLKKKSRAV